MTFHNIRDVAQMYSLPNVAPWTNEVSYLPSWIHPHVKDIAYIQQFVSSLVVARILGLSHSQKYTSKRKKKLC